MTSSSLFPALTDPASAGRTALSFPDRSLTYAQLRAAGGAVATAIAGLQRVAVVAENRLETCVAVIGALEAGVPLVPLNPKSGASELRHVIADAAPQAVLTAPGTKPPEALRTLPAIQVDATAASDSDSDSDGDRDRDERDADAERRLDPETTALIVYTSGTTGAPKGALIPRRAIASNLDALAEIWAWTNADVVTHALPLFHVHGLVIGILGPIRRGGQALHLGRFDPDAVTAALTGAATMLFGVPTMYRRLAETAEGDRELAAALAGARVLVSGSAALPAAEHDRLRRLTGRAVLERYGMTETLMNTGIRVDGRGAPGTVGPPLPGVELRLVDDDGALLPDDEPETIGEVQVRGPNVFAGYLNRDDATAMAFTDDGWFATGDMATRLADGYIRLVGRRATDLIKSGGYKIGAGEIEGSLCEHPAIADAAVTGEPDDDLGERIVAWVVTAEPAPEPRERLRGELIDHVAGQLAPHKRPRVVHFLPELPRNDLGKIQKQRLRPPD